MNRLSKSIYGTTKNGEIVEEYQLKNQMGSTLKVITYGGTVTSWEVKDQHGKYSNIVLGLDSLQAYENSPMYFGAIVGRFCNRIAHGRFMLDDETIQLDINQNPHHLHGGMCGLDKVVWKATSTSNSSSASVTLQHLSVHRQGGYPGNVQFSATYTLTDKDEVHIDYEARSDRKTIVNLTHHSYFNLSDQPSKPILDHRLCISADYFLPVDSTLIPTGEIRPVIGTPFDFTKWNSVGEHIDSIDEQLKFGNGYDHCWVLNQSGKYRKVCALEHSDSGRHLEVWTDRPGMQVYTGNHLAHDDSKEYSAFVDRAGICLETQDFPNAPNQPNFPSVEIEAGETYTSKTMYKLEVENGIK